MARARWKASGLYGLAASLSIASLAGPAEAQVRLAVVSVELEGGDAPEARDSMASALSAGLRPAASLVIPPAEVERRLSLAGELPPWDSPAWAAEAGRLLEVHALVRARVEQLEQHYVVEAELVLARDGSRLAATSLECAACTWSEALETMTRAGNGLETSLPGLLDVSVAPDGASVTVDGRPLDADGEDAVAPGPHVVAARATGHLPARQEVTVVAGGATAVRLTLSPVAAAPAAERAARPGRGPWVAAWVTGGAALAALVPGVLWLALDGRCPIDFHSTGAGTCPQVYDLWPQGLALTAAGAALLATSVTLFALVAYGRRQTRAGAALVIGPGAEGPVLSIAGWY